MIAFLSYYPIRAEKIQIRPLEEVRTINAALFQQLFQRFDAPVILKGGDQWHLNPAAQSLELSTVELELLADHKEDAFLWLSHQFYHVSTSEVDGLPLIMLRPDSFFTSAADRVASQLRTQLNAAFGPAFSLSENRFLRSDPRAHEQLAALNQALYQIFRMVIQFEQCSDPDDLSAQFAAIDLVQWFQRLSEELRELCEEVDIKFTSQTDQTYLPMLVNGKQLELLILCLVSNALKNAPEKDGRVSVSLKRQKDQAIITVSDNAGGFSPELLTHPLWSQPVRPLPNQGLGLGLPLVQRVVAAHEGTLMAFPASTGTRMVLSLPIRVPDDTFSTSCPPGWDDFAPGFSLAKIFLSDILPASLYYPDPNGDEGA